MLSQISPVQKKQETNPLSYVATGLNIANSAASLGDRLGGSSVGAPGTTDKVTDDILQKQWSAWRAKQGMK